LLRHDHGGKKCRIGHLVGRHFAAMARSRASFSCFVSGR
jgi:hypothetical protein